MLRPASAMRWQQQLKLLVHRNKVTVWRCSGAPGPPKACVLTASVFILIRFSYKTHQISLIIVRRRLK